MISFRNNNVSLFKDLQQKDEQIRQLSDYLDAVKKEYTNYRQQTSIHTYVSQKPMDMSPGSKDDSISAGKSLDKNHHEQLIDLHSTIFNLQ
jgi:ribosomal protein L29